MKSQNNTESVAEPKNVSNILSQDMKKSILNMGDDKKQKDRKSEKSSKSIKKHYDQDVHSDDYSTWLPPQDQTGDGKTSLNDKYGY